METNELRNDEIDRILKKQCEIYDFDFDKVQWSSDEWFRDNTITQEQEDEFREWMIISFKIDQKMRDKLMQNPSMVNSDIENVVEAFITYYGFRVEK